MPGSMPYHLEKGPYFAVVEDFCNGDPARLAQALIDLRAGAPIPEIGGVIDSKNISAGQHTSERVKKHLYEDWFGYPPGQKVGPQPKFGSGNLQTGYWQQYYGNAEAILRETLIRAAEVALGIDHGAPVPTGAPPRHWTLEFFWKCGQPWWEGWVTWRHDPATSSGQVTVILATPGTGHQVLENPTTGRQDDPYAVDPGGTKDPGGAERQQGMWLVTHNDHQRHTVLTNQKLVLGQWVYPIFGSVYEGHGPIVVVQTAESDGGVKAKGRKFVPAGT